MAPRALAELPPERADLARRKSAPLCDPGRFVTCLWHPSRLLLGILVQVHGGYRGYLYEKNERDEFAHVAGPLPMRAERAEAMHLLRYILDALGEVTASN